MSLLLRKLITGFGWFGMGMACLRSIRLCIDLDKQLKFHSEAYEHAVQVLNLPEMMASSDSIKRGVPSIKETDNKLPVKQEPVEQQSTAERQQPDTKSAVKQEPVLVLVESKTTTGRQVAENATEPLSVKQRIDQLYQNKSRPWWEQANKTNKKPVDVEEPVSLFSSVDQLDKERADQLNKERAWVPEEQAVRIRYKAFAGLGHRLVRMSNAFHLSKALNVTRLSMDWRKCNGAPIFDHLFGKGPLVVPSPTQPLFSFLHFTDGRLGRRDAVSTVTFKSDVPYYTDTFSNRELSSLQNMTPPYFGKIQSDMEMYRQLLTLFRFRGSVQTFRQANNVSDHTLLGLHVRAGNGEQGDFNEKGRAFSDLDRWISNITDLISGYSQRQAFSRPPMIFLSTDTFEVISKLRDAFSKHGIPVIFAPQDWVPSGKGASYQYNNGLNKSSCLQGWMSQFMDMMLLSESDVLIAGAYSSFTQTLPLSIMFDKAASSSSGESSGLVPPKFCEIVVAGDLMFCFDNFRDWSMEKEESRFPEIVNNQTHDRVSARIRNLNMFPRPSEMTLEALQKLFNKSGLVLNWYSTIHKIYHHTHWYIQFIVLASSSPYVITYLSLCVCQKRDLTFVLAPTPQLPYTDLQIADAILYFLTDSQKSTLLLG